MFSRRGMVSGALSVAGLAALSARSGATRHGRIPQRASARVIIDNDFAGDPDGLVALAHQLLTPKTITALITSTPLDPKMVASELRGRSAAAGKDVVLELCRRIGIKSPPLVIGGSETLNEENPTASPAARAIVSEAMRDDPMPLFFTCGGPLTNLAAALRLEPAIAERMTVIWIGGGRYPQGGWEYNLATDAAAARHVIERSAVPLWQIPQNTYRQIQISIAELEVRLRSTGAFGDWLYEKFTTPPSFVSLGGAWPLGDSPTVLLTAISAESSSFVDRTARRIRPDLAYGSAIKDRSVRIYEEIDVRLAIEDFFALMQLHSEGTLDQFDRPPPKR